VTLIVAGVALVAIDSGFYAGGSSSASWATSDRNSARTRSPRRRQRHAAHSSRPPGQTPRCYAVSIAGSVADGAPAGLHDRGGSLVYYAADGTVVPSSRSRVCAPRWSRASAVLRAASNRYGLKAESYAGEFDPNVTMQQADGSSADRWDRTGRIGREPPYRRQAGDYLHPCPALERGSAGGHQSRHQDGRCQLRSIRPSRLVGHAARRRRFSGPLPVVNAIPNNAGYHVLVEQLGVTAWQVIDPVRLGLSRPSSTRTTP